MEIHEFGQIAVIKRISPRRSHRRITDARERDRVRKMFLSGRLTSKPLRRITRSVRYPPRPFAYPTTVIVARQMPAMWANSITSATVKGK
jgi:hypothetical protein